MKPHQKSHTHSIFATLLLVGAALTASAQRRAPFTAPAVTNVPPGGAVMRAERAAPLPERRPEERMREAELARANVLAASSNTVGLARSAQRINTVPGGGRADFGLLKVFFPADANGVERFRVTTPDGRELTFQPRFLAWHDTSTGERWLLAEVTNRLGLIMPSGQVLYTNAFDADIHADLRFRYGRNLLEQDVILRERPAVPDGMSAENLRLEVWTEWFDSVPAARRTRLVDLRRGQGDGAQALASDDEADFLSAKIGGGSAFSTGEPDDKFPVAKTWARVEGRDWLIETVDYPALKLKFDALGGSGRKRTAKAGSSQEELIRLLAVRAGNGAPISDPASSLIESAERAGSETGAPTLLLAQANPPETPGVVVDFAIIACVPVPPGVISWWPAGGNAKDAITASGNNGTLYNAAAYGAGKVGQGFVFNAAGYVQMPNAASFSPQSGLTVEAWVFFTSAASGLNKPIVSKDGGYGREYLLTKTWDNVIRAHVGIAGDAFRYTDGQMELEPNTWHHVAMTYSAADSALAIYVDGELDVVAQVTGSLLTSLEPLYIGGAPYWNYYWSGGIDEASVYDRALSAAEIQIIYEAGAAGKINPNCVTAPTDVVAWLPGDTHAYDVQRGGAATLQNGATYAPAVASHGFSFDGVNDGVTTPDDGALDFAAGQDFSLEVWLKAETSSPTYGVMSVLGKRNSPNSYTALGWELFLINGQPGLQLADASGPANFIATGDLRNTGWRHVVVTVDRDSTTGVRFYVDGAAVVQLNPTGKAGNLSNSGLLRIGVHPQPGLNCFYKGIIDEATVYRRALSGTEVSALYQAGSAGKCKGDVDSDGMGDWWEMHYFGNLDRTGTADYDADGLTDLEEFQLKTDPTMVELLVEAYKSPCEDKVYVKVSNQSEDKITGGSFDLFVYLDGVQETHYATLQPWGPNETLPPGSHHTFTICTPDEWITDFDCRVIHQAASGGNLSQKFRITIRQELARVFKNTTQISDPCLECSNCAQNPPPTIPPQARNHCDAELTPPQVWCEPLPCGPWPQPLPASSNPTGGSQHVDNFYKPSEKYIDLSCPKKGFKNVYAIKQWHGIFGPRSESRGRPIASMMGNCDCETGSGPVAEADTTKYLQLHGSGIIESHFSYRGEEMPVIYGAASRDCSINPQTGRVTRAATESGNASDAWGAVRNVHLADLPGIYCAQVTAFSQRLHGLPGPNGPVDITATFTAGDKPAMEWNYEWSFASECGTLSGHSRGYVRLDLAGGTFACHEDYLSDFSASSSPDCPDPGSSSSTFDVRTYTITISTAQVASSGTWRFGSSPNSGIHWGKSGGTVTYSQPYTSTMVNEDADVLLATWNLLDDTEYPWRTDGGVTRGPLVTRNERGQIAPSIDFALTNIGTAQAPNWQAPQDASLPPWPSQPEGAILGAPLPVRGQNGELRTYEPYFNFYHPNWHFEYTDVGFPEAFLQSRGAFSPHPNATQWVDDNLARVLPGGPFWGYGTRHGDDKFTFWFKNPYLTDTKGEWEHGGSAGTLIKCKWAETIDEPDPEHGKDFVFKDWKFNFRDFAESYHSCIATYYRNEVVNPGRADAEPPLPPCPSLGACSPVRFTPIAENYPLGNIIGNGSLWISAMTTTPLHYDYNCCRPVVLVQPNNPGGCNGLFVQMPPAVCDERYGSLWMGRVDQTTSDINSCPNYVANRNAGIANPADCDPQIELRLIWHPFYDAHGIPVSGRYEIFVEPLGFDPGGGTPRRVDLDVDSDNNNALDPPDRSSFEDAIEGAAGLPGKVIAVNADDSDNDSIPDFADGFNWGASAADDASPNDRFIPLVLELSEGIDPTTARLRLTYSASDPTQVAFDAASSTWQPAPSGNLRIWKKDGNVARNKSGTTGDYIPPGIYDDLSRLDLSTGNRIVTLYVEGILPSSSHGDQQILVEFDSDGNVTSGWERSDAVRVSVFGGALIPDINRDGEINDADRQMLVSDGPFRFWINDDGDHSSSDTSGDDVPGAELYSTGPFGPPNPNYVTMDDLNIPHTGDWGIVDGRRDLVDFFPVRLDIDLLLRLFPPGNYVYKLKHTDGAVNVVFTPFDSLSPNLGWAFQKDFDLAASVLSLNTWRVSAQGLEIPNEFLNSIPNDGKGVILVEGRASSLEPLVLSVERLNGEVLAEVKMPLSLSSVEDMYRHLNLNYAASGGNNEVDSRTTAPNWPDKLSNGKNFVFLHGYNVNQQQARGWSAEFFKRMYWSGSKARFYPVSWYAYETQIFLGVSYNLQTNIVHAFETAPALANFLNNLPGETVIAGHSLGNMLASAAITLNNGTATKYFMIDGAVAKEAFAPTLVVQVDMVNQNWNDYYVGFGGPNADFLFASEWYKLFPNTDPRSKLTWRGLFTDWGTTQVYNLYSSGEEVMGNIPHDKGNDFNILHAAKYPWGCQEKLKGRMDVELLGSTIAGWGFNMDDYGSWTDPGGWERMPPANAQLISPSQLVTKPFFEKSPADLFSTDSTTAQNYAQQNYYDLLSRAIPARTYGVGANPIGNFPSIDMQSLQVQDPQQGWPSSRENNDWWHSDCRDVAYLFTHRLFETIVELGELE